jgi:hypothetical protein
MANTGYTDVPGVGIGAVDLPFRVKASESVGQYQAIAFYTSGTGTVEVQITTTANDKMAGINQEGFIYTDFPTGHIFYISVRVAGTTHYIAGADCSSARGDYLVLEGTDGRMTVCAALANTHYVIQGLGLDNPDADANIGTMLMMLNVPYFVSAS